MANRYGCTRSGGTELVNRYIHKHIVRKLDKYLWLIDKVVLGLEVHSCKIDIYINI